MKALRTELVLTSLAGDQVQAEVLAVRQQVRLTMCRGLAIGVEVQEDSKSQKLTGVNSSLFIVLRPQKPQITAVTWIHTYKN